MVFAFIRVVALPHHDEVAGTVHRHGGIPLDACRVRVDPELTPLGQTGGVVASSMDAEVVA
jgi:hypothetical protein